VKPVADLLHQVLDTGRKDALIIVPPFVDVVRPSLGVHLLLAEAKRAGFEISILYANMLFAEHIGAETYRTLAAETTYELMGEMCFRAAAFASNGNARSLAVSEAEYERFGTIRGLDFATFSKLNLLTPAWCDELCAAIDEYSFPVVGCSTTFEQTCASLAILKRIKERNPRTKTILGGANCEGEMADGIVSLNSCVDHVFSGESEKSFVSFLGTHSSEARVGPDKKIIRSAPNYKLDELAPPSYEDFFRQLTTILPDLKFRSVGIPYETSRGCWWGEKHHCTFCGLNGQGMGFREKSPDVVLRDLEHFARSYESNYVIMTDNIMPHSYYNTLLPRVVEGVPKIRLFYEVKANLTLAKVELLRAAGVFLIQPGIEALSTPLLKHMKKGVKASQNIALLRYARSIRLGVLWNLLGSFPGDRAEWYRDTNRIVSYIRHLQPPWGFFPLRLQRFSPYHNDPESFGVSNVRPMAAYERIFPADSDIQKIAYHFQGDYESESEADDHIGADLTRSVADWRQQWQGGVAPQLHVTKISDEFYILHDSRAIDGLPEVEFIDEEQARVCLWGAHRNAGSDAVEWALQRFACLRIDEEVVPLATADAKLMHWLEGDSGTERNTAAAAASVHDAVMTA